MHQQAGCVPQQWHMLTPLPMRYVLRRCEPHEMIFIGDRYLTDVVFGNRHGMLTIRVAPLTSKGEPPTVAAARLVENACVSRWSAAGLRAPAHHLLPFERVSQMVVAKEGTTP